jgi:hypothetical protein
MEGLVETIIEPVVISYKGADADSNLVDLAQLGQSMQGAAKLLGAAANVVVTGQYAKKSPTFAVRVLTGPPRAGSVDIFAYFVSMMPNVYSYLPGIGDVVKDAGKRAVEGITNYTIAKFAKREDAASEARLIAETALKEMGHTSRTAIEAMERVALNNGPAVRLFVTPIGHSCGTAQIGSPDNASLPVDANMRLTIDSNDPYEVGPESIFEILISELDLKNRSCKFLLREDEDTEQRYSGDITDPQIGLPRNPYSAAMDSQRWIMVKGKPRLRDGEIERLYISDVILATADS